MINCDDITKVNIEKRNPDCSQIWGSGSGSENVLFNLINQPSDTDNISLYAKNPYEPNRQL